MVNCTVQLTESVKHFCCTPKSSYDRHADTTVKVLSCLKPARDLNTADRRMEIDVVFVVSVYDARGECFEVDMKDGVGSLRVLMRDDE